MSTSATRAARHVVIAAGLALSLSLAACGKDAAPQSAIDPTPGASTVSITDSQERTVELTTQPEVVVATDWSVIRTLNDLGIEVDAVPTANGTLPADLQKFTGDQFTKVGTLHEPDFEAISALDPDLVIVGSRSGTPEVVAEIEKITPNVVDLSVRAETAADQLPLTRKRVVQLGMIFGKQSEAEQRMDAIEAAMAEVKTKASKLTTPTMFVQVSGGTAGAYGPGSRFGTIYSDFGYTAIKAPLDEDGSHGQEISQEFFAQYNPGLIFVLDRSKAIGESETPALEVLNNDLVNTTDAAKNNRLVEVDGFSWYLATAAPSSLEQQIADAAQGLLTP